eukprot:8187532-Pyramimonas_sp.AAC.1
MLCSSSTLRRATPVRTTSTVNHDTKSLSLTDSLVKAQVGSGDSLRVAPPLAFAAHVCYARVTPVSRPCHARVTPVLRPCHARVTPVLRPCHA